MRTRNRFWKNLYIAGFTDRQLAPQEYPELLAYGIGMTDLCKEESGLDAQLSKDAYDETRLLQLIQKYQPRYLVFSGLRPARAFLRGCFDVPVNKVQAGLQPQQIGYSEDSRLNCNMVRCNSVGCPQNMHSFVVL
ncbi:MAG: mismatch-specific DNA-glycosylase [Deltaproteobacteria bacterium]|nr:mismatch-specific DNA-glycosylase [Deltaproteobacteria bacterium]